VVSIASKQMGHSIISVTVVMLLGNKLKFELLIVELLIVEVLRERMFGYLTVLYMKQEFQFFLFFTHMLVN
jgi:hypothetical protein